MKSIVPAALLALLAPDPAAAGPAPKPPVKEAARAEPLLPAPPAVRPSGPATPDEVMAEAFGAFQRGYFVTALEMALPLAEAGLRSAQTLVGEIHAKGLGVRRDPALAGQWYRRAAAQGDAAALVALGLMALDREGSMDRKAAAGFLEQAAAKGHAEAAFRLALLLLDGEARTRNAPRAAALLRRAAESGHAEAAYVLGQLYRAGDGVPASQTEAARWIGAAAQNGLTPAQVEYGILVFNGKGVTKDEAAAAHWFRRAALAGNAIGQNRLARMLAAGRGVPIDLAAAAKWHYLARGAGISDPALDRLLSALGKADRDKAKAAAKAFAAPLAGEAEPIGVAAAGPPTP